MAKRTKESYTIQSVVHSLELLEQFHGDEAEIGVTELSRRLGLHKNNVFRLLATLEVRGYVVQNLETEGYRLGVKALELGRSYLRHSDIVAMAGTKLAELRDLTQETCYLTILQGEEVVYVLAEESPQSVRVTSLMGQHFPAMNTAEGKVQLAYENTLPYRTHPLRRMTDPKPTDLRKLERDLVKIREQGCSVDSGEFNPEITCIAAPVFDDTGGCTGAIAIHAPSFRANRDRSLKQLTDQLLDIAAAISEKLGFIGHGQNTAASAATATALSA